MNRIDDTFVPDDPLLYGPDPHHPQRRAPLTPALGLSIRQSVAVLLISLLVFLFLGGPLWSASRQTFPLRLFASYLIIPLLVAGQLRWNGVRAWRTTLVTSIVLAGIKFVITVAIDVGQGLFRHWPP